MTSLLVGLLVALSIAVAVLVYELHGMPRLRRRCIVNLRGETDSLEGVLWTRRGRWLVLKDARLVRANGEVTPADGEVLVDRATVSFLQVL